MNISFEKTGNVSAVLTLKMEKSDYESKVKDTLKTYSRKAQMPGFRPGKVPFGLIQKMYGAQAKAEEVNKLLNDSLFNYIKENKVNMLGEPLSSEQQTMQDIEKQDDFEFIFDIALAPEFTVDLSADDHVDFYDIETTDEQINEQVKNIAQRAGHSENVDSYENNDILCGVLAELDENGQPKEGGLVVEKVSLMPTYFKNDDQKKIFEGAKKNDVLTFNPSMAYEGSEYYGDFSFQVDEISRFVAAEVNQELFDNVFGKDNVKSEEEFRGKIKENIEKQHVADSDYKFLLDLRAYMEQKVGELEFPTELLKKIMKANNKDKGEEFVEKNFDKSIEELKWHLIKEQLVEKNGIKVDDKELKETAVQAARFQFAQYGMTDIPEEYLEQYATEMLKKREQVNALVERCIDTKLVEAVKSVVTLDHKSISVEDFSKMFN